MASYSFNDMGGIEIDFRGMKAPAEIRNKMKAVKENSPWDTFTKYKDGSYHIKLVKYPNTVIAVSPADKNCFGITLKLYQFSAKRLTVFDLMGLYQLIRTIEVAIKPQVIIYKA